jgi:protease IV
MGENTQSAQEAYHFDDPAGRQKKKGLKGWQIWLLIVVILAVITGIVLFAGIGGSHSVKDVASTPNTPYIGVLYVEGTIAASNVDSWGVASGYQHQFTLDSIDELIGDPDNKGLVLFVDSPGGGVYESDELYYKIKEYKEKTKRPVYAYFGSMAASGGYYISTPADKILANRNCWTGSIGVTIGTVYDISGLLQKYGIKTVTITSGRNKAMGSMVDPLTDEQRAIFQSLVNEAYEQFTGIVSTERGIDLATVKTIADGRIYSAKQAYSLKLIDGICTYDDALTYMKKTCKLQKCEVYDITYQDDSLFGRLFSEIPRPTLPESDTNAVLSLIKDDVRFPISYMCEALDRTEK